MELVKVLVLGTEQVKLEYQGMMGILMMMD
jgi:hypothetical protein